MELVLELFLTLFVAVVFSFLVAKLISIASAGAADREPPPNEDLDGSEFLARDLATLEDECRLRSIDSDNTDRLAPEGVNEETHEFEKIESVNRLESSISRDELVLKQLRESVATTDVDVAVESLETISHEFSAETAQEVEVKGLTFHENFDRKDVIEFDETAKEDLISKVSTHFDESDAFGELNVVNSLAEGVQILESVEANDQIGREEEEVDQIRDEGTMEVKSDQNQGSGTSGKELNQGDERKQEWSDGNEDDWEGVEQSKLQKVFDQASKFVARMGEDTWGNDLHMQLYGLHKVALEGPCQEPQPMALKLSARSKWNAWQRLGNMSPDVAMEHYINLLSDKYPQWMEENLSGDITKNTLEAGGPGHQDDIEDKPYEGKEMDVKFITS